MNLSPSQLAKLRAVGRSCNELELRHAARRAAISTQRDYIATLQHRLEQLPRARDAANREQTSNEQREASVSRFDQEEKRLRNELSSAQGEIAHLREHLAQITAVSAPLRELRDRLLQYARLSRRDAGIGFGDDAPSSRIDDVVEVG
ncbi:MAG: hypothetical protein WDZ66_03970 [Steroidobacteraceae bacterium]